jgi:protein-S-isoprenylcysteine O-methyltransferase Ste14
MTMVLFVALFTVPRSFETVSGEVLEMTGYLLLIAAALGRVWCGIYIAGRKDRELCTEGPYSRSRNPLYFFSFLGVMGMSMALQSLLLLAVASVVFLAYYHRVMREEERRLTGLFGESYEEYTRQVPRFLPSWKSIPGSEERVVHLRILERSLREVVWFLLAIVAIEVLELVHHAGYLILFRMPL